MQTFKTETRKDFVSYKGDRLKETKKKKSQGYFCALLGEIRKGEREKYGGRERDRESIMNSYIMYCSDTNANYTNRDTTLWHILTCHHRLVHAGYSY